MRKVWMFCGVVLASLAPRVQAQTGAKDRIAEQSQELKRLLVKLGEDAVELDKSLPSFSCEENVVSQEIRGGKVRRGVTFTATLRAQRGEDGRLSENFQITTVDGRPFTEGGVDTPVMVTGGFDKVMRYFHPEQQRCYDYQMSPGRIDFTNSVDGAARGCKETGMVGFARLDAEDNVTSIERSVPVEKAKPLHLASFATVTVTPVRMGDKTYRLASHVIAEMPQGRSVGRFEATYSHCRLYTSTVTIEPGETIPEASSASKH